MNKIKSICQSASAKTKQVWNKVLGLDKSNNKKNLKRAIFVIVVIIVAVVIKLKMPREMTMEDAARIGDKKTYQLLVKIDNSRGNGGFERGDIILTAPEDKKFSIAEEEGFLIIKMGLTEQQTGLLLQQKGELERQKEMSKEPKERKAPEKEQAIRRFKVDLKKMGIADNELKGRVIADKVWDWQEVVSEKK